SPASPGWSCDAEPGAFAVRYSCILPSCWHAPSPAGSWQFVDTSLANLRPASGRPLAAPGAPHGWPPQLAPPQISSAVAVVTTRVAPMRHAVHRELGPRPIGCASDRGT